MKIGKYDIPTLTNEFGDFNTIEVTCGTNGYGGGDWGHGGRLFVNITNMAGTAWDVKVNGTKHADPYYLEIVAGGDSELDAFADAFLWMGEYLKSQLHPEEKKESVLEKVRNSVYRNMFNVLRLVKKL